MNKCNFKKYFLFILKFLIVPIVLAITEYLISVNDKIFALGPIRIFISSITAGYIGFLLVEIVDSIRKPKIKFITFKRQPFNSGGELLNLIFKIEGLKSPGFSSIQINWDDKSVYAKWPQTANPLIGDSFSRFEPNLVPQTFYIPLYSGLEYSVPVLHVDKDEITVFSGWWFAWKQKQNYGPDPLVKLYTNIQIIINGNGLSWQKEFIVKEITRIS